MSSKAFRGEIWTNVDPRVLEAMISANAEPVSGCVGKDRHSLRTIGLVQRHFKTQIHAAFTINGTGANILALKAMLDRWGSVICTADTHIHSNEAGATEHTTGCKVFCAEAEAGKLSPAALESCLDGCRRFLPQVVVITQPTELGVLYTVEELKELCDCAHTHGLYVYMDGARIGHALAALNTDLTEMIEYPDVDAFSIGGTKAGAMFGEMVVFRRAEFAEQIDYLQKQSFQHFDKSAFLGVQMECLLEQGILLDNARKANLNAKLLEAVFREKGIAVGYPVQTNAVFARLDPQTLAKLTAVYDLHYWDEPRRLVRFMTTANTSQEELDTLAALL